MLFRSLIILFTSAGYADRGRRRSSTDNLVNVHIVQFEQLRSNVRQATQPQTKCSNVISMNLLQPTPTMIGCRMSNHLTSGKHDVEILSAQTGKELRHRRSTLRGGLGQRMQDLRIRNYDENSAIREYHKAEELADVANIPDKEPGAVQESRNWFYYTEEDESDEENRKAHRGREKNTYRKDVKMADRQKMVEALTSLWNGEDMHLEGFVSGKKRIKLDRRLSSESHACIPSSTVRRHTIETGLRFLSSRKRASFARMSSACDDSLCDSGSKNEALTTDKIIDDLAAVVSQHAASPLTTTGLKERLQDLCARAMVAAWSCDEIVEQMSIVVSEYAASPLKESELKLVLSLLLGMATASELKKLDMETVLAMRLPELRAALEVRKLSTNGKKSELQARLLESIALPTVSALPSDDDLLVALLGDGGNEKSSSSSVQPSLPIEPWLENQLAETIQKYAGTGPQTGIFTDGSARPNPGPGGWGVVVVDAGRVVWQTHGSAKDTTNNRMELSAIIAALRHLPEDAPAIATNVIYSDSNLCVKTLNEWAHKWAANGWRRKTGPVENEDLVREAYALARARPGVKLQWRKGHNGDTWNEYADRLASSAYQRFHIGWGV